MEKVTIYYQLIKLSDGSVCPIWFLTEQCRDIFNNTQETQLGDSEGHVETFIGSDIYSYAENNEEEYGSN